MYTRLPPGCQDAPDIEPYFLSSEHANDEHSVIMHALTSSTARAGMICSSTLPPLSYPQDSLEYRAAYDAVIELRSLIAEWQNTSNYNILKPK
jgi:hypothetical protein